MTVYDLLGDLAVPAAAAFSGTYQAGTIFEVTADALWFNAFRWPVAASGQQAGPVSCALWQPIDATHFALVPNSSVTSGALTVGSWNTIPLAAPIGLSKLVPYTVCIAYTSTTGFPFLTGQFGAGQTFAAGKTVGPLFAWSDTGGSAPAPASQSQGLFGTGASTANGTLANSNYPGAGSSGSSNFYAGALVGTIAPANAQLQLWPSQPVPVNAVLDDTTALGQVVTVATEIILSAPGVLNQILCYQVATCTSLPTKTAVFTVPGGTIVPGTLNAAPSWSGAAGSGWISVNYAGVTLPAGRYRLAVSAPAGKFNSTTATSSYWAGGGPGASGIVNGILSAPNLATADSPGQGSFAVAADIAAPNQNVGGFSYWIDGLFTPVQLGGGGGDNGGIGVRPGQLFPSGRRRRGGRLYAA